MSIFKHALVLALVAGTVSGAALAASAGAHLSDWGPAALVDPPADGVGVNTTANDGCPIESPDGRSLYIASNRSGGAGALDLWVAHREGTDEPWGNPVNLNDASGADLNTSFDEFCPTPVRGNGLFFVRRPSACGLGDIYFTRFNPRHGWSEPERLACAPEGPNSVLDEMGPSYVQAGGGARLYFSSSRAASQPGGFVPGDIFVSRMGAGGTFGPAELVAELSDPVANDIQPNVRKNGREVVFSSNRAGGKGSQDIWVATRKNGGDAWSQPVNLVNLGDPSQQVNTSDSETRPSLSRRGERLYFGRAPAAGGPADVYVTTREKDDD
jgi:Tol biopolymer transport system component